MNDAQVWTAMISGITLLAAAMSVIFRLITRTMSAELRAGFSEMTLHVNGSLAQQDERIDRRFAQIERQFAVLGAKIDAQSRRIDGLDADVQAITRRIIDGPDAA